MSHEESIRHAVHALLRQQQLGVLSTVGEDAPYASLVAFAATEDLKHIYFVTPTTTRKYANLTADGRVSVLVNSSTNQSSDFHQAISATAVGDAKEINGPERGQLLRFYLGKHPYLEEFAKSPTCALVRVTVRSYYLVRNFQKVLEFHLVK